MAGVTIPSTGQFVPEGTTLRVRGTGGAVFDLDVPSAPIRQRLTQYQFDVGQLFVLGQVVDGVLLPLDADVPVPAEAPPAPQDPAGEQAPETVDGAPSPTANKGVWVAYAVSLGADGDEVAGMSKPQIIELYGSTNEEG